jgi:hypothetical protein
VLLARRDEQRIARCHVNGLSGGSESRAAGCDEVDLVLFMWLLRIAGASRNAVRAEAQAWSPEVFAILRSARSLIDSYLCQMLHRVILEWHQL